MKWWQIALIILYVADLVYLNYSSFSSRQTLVTTSVVKETIVPTPVDQCGPECQKYINVKIAALPTNPLISSIVITSTPLKSRSRHISYLPISVGGSTGSNSWVDLPGTDFYFDIDDYPGLKDIYFETNLHLFNGNGTAFVRLYDVTHGVGVQGSEVQTNHQPDTAVISGQVSFYKGKNLIRVQAKSLTADTTVFTSGRLRIITEN